MARYAQGGGGGGGGSFHSVDHSEWMPGPNAFADPNDLLNRTILNQNEIAWMHDFFNDPDGPAINDHFAMNWPGDMDKATSGGFGGEGNVSEHQSQVIHNPAMTHGGSSNSALQTHPTQDNHSYHFFDSRAGLMADMKGTEQDSNEEDVKAASGLMRMNGQDGSRATAAAFAPLAGGSWGNFGGPNNLVFGAQNQTGNHFASPGGQYQNLSHNAGRSNVPFQNGQVPMVPQYAWQEQHMASVPRARHNSLQLETSQINFFPQTNMPHSAHLPGQRQTVSRPPAVRFGSDQNFRDGGYRAPSGHGSLEYEKGANLNYVPFAAQAAAEGQIHVQSFTPVDAPRNFPHYPGPPSASAVHSASTTSSPHHLGGLPFHPMAPNTYHHGHPWPKMVRHTTEEDDEIESEPDAEFDDLPPHKRRKSHLHHEDDSKYNPHHVKARATKRASKAAKARGGDDDGSDDEYEEITPAANRTSVKRRKSSTNARPHLGSSQSGSPAAVGSPTGKVASSGKKKGRGTQSRQNLTEDEKRRNHIQSEKTRRDLIKLQYDALDSLVPTLKNGKSGLSRSDVLREISTFVESSVEGNKNIEAILGVKVDMEEGSDDEEDDSGSG